MFPYRSPLGLIYDCGDFVGNMRARRRARRLGRVRRAPRGQRARAGCCAASASRTTSNRRSARRASASPSPLNPTASSTSLPARSPTVRVTKRRSRRSRPNCSACRWRRSCCAPATPRSSKSGGGSHSNRSMRLVGTLLVEICEALQARASELGAPDVRAAARIARAARRDAERAADITRRIPAFPTGCAVCEVEIDPATGTARIARYTSVDDAGRAINPMIVDGQTHGGIAQGIGQALYEQLTFDPETGQPIGASFMAYAAPRAFQVPAYDLELTEDATTGNPLGDQGRRRSGGDAVTCRDRQRAVRRAAAVRRRGHRHAGDAGKGLAHNAPPKDKRMKIARYNGGKIGIVVGDRIVDVTRICGVDPGEWPPVGMNRVIAGFAELRPKIEAALDDGAERAAGRRAPRNADSLAAQAAGDAVQLPRTCAEMKTNGFGITGSLTGRRSGVLHEVERLADRPRRADRHPRSARPHVPSRMRDGDDHRHRRQGHPARQSARPHLRLRVS